MSQLPERVQDRYLPGLAPLPLDDMLRGMIRTSSRNSLVTDSAAGATAYACGRKSDNGVYGASHKRHYGTLLEAAKLKGMRTGVVVTSSVTHATPAAFTAHGLNREDENAIAAWQISGAPLDRPGEPMVDVLLGGGLCRFLPTNTTSNGVASCRADGVDLLKAAKERFGYTVITTPDALHKIVADSSHKRLPLLGLFSREHMAYEIERDAEKEPSLSDMLRSALYLLGPHHTDAGFFLFVEGSKIDMAAHENDAPTHAIEVLEYNRAVQVAKDWVLRHPDTLLLSVADHETGGLSLGRRNEPNYWIYAYPYRYMPLSFADIHRSALSVSRQLVQFARNLNLDSTNAFSPIMAKPRKRLLRYIYDTILAVYKVKPLDATLDKAYFIVTMHDQAPNYVDENHFRVARVIGDAVAIQAGIAWSTPGHTGVDICLYGMGAGAPLLNNCMENTDVHYVVKDLLNLDTDAVSDLLLASTPSPSSSLTPAYSGNLGSAR
jgi:alkaline phosphatase